MNSRASSSKSWLKSNTWYEPETAFGGVISFSSDSQRCFPKGCFVMMICFPAAEEGGAAESEGEGASAEGG